MNLPGDFIFWIGWALYFASLQCVIEATKAWGRHGFKAGARYYVPLIILAEVFMLAAYKI